MKNINSTELFQLVDWQELIRICPLIMDLKKKATRENFCNVRYSLDEFCIINHDEFEEIIKNWWDTSLNLDEKTYILKDVMEQYITTKEYFTYKVQEIKGVL